MKTIKHVTAKTIRPDVKGTQTIYVDHEAGGSVSVTFYGRKAVVTIYALDKAEVSSGAAQLVVSSFA